MMENQSSYKMHSIEEKKIVYYFGILRLLLVQNKSSEKENFLII